MSDAPDDPSPPVPDDLLTDTDAAADADGFENPILDGLLSTEPDQSVPRVADEMGMERWQAHGLVGVKKFINGIVGAGVRSGTTALENFLAAGMGVVMDQGDDSDDRGEIDMDGALDPEEL